MVMQLEHTVLVVQVPERERERERENKFVLRHVAFTNWHGIGGQIAGFDLSIKENLGILALILGLLSTD
jgi:hypothetical protein